jgi:uncharacterized protein DUF6968
VIVKFWAPRKATQNGYWESPYQVVGLGGNKIECSPGEDGVQALLLAMQAVRKKLHDSGKRLSWIGGEPGDNGFPYIIPALFGPKFSRHLESLVEREIHRFALNIARTRRKTKRSQRAR